MQKYIPKELVNKFNNRKKRQSSTNLPPEEEEEEEEQPQETLITTSTNMSKYKLNVDTIPQKVVPPAEKEWTVIKQNGTMPLSLTPEQYRQQPEIQIPDPEKAVNAIIKQLTTTALKPLEQLKSTKLKEQTVDILEVLNQKNISFQKL